MKSLKLPIAFVLGILSAFVVQHAISPIGPMPKTTVATLQSNTSGLNGVSQEGADQVPDKACVVSPKYMFGHCVDRLEDEICTICSQQLSE